MLLYGLWLLDVQITDIQSAIECGHPRYCWNCPTFGRGSFLCTHFLLKGINTKHVSQSDETEYYSPLMREAIATLLRFKEEQSLLSVKSGHCSTPWGASACSAFEKQVMVATLKMVVPSSMVSRQVRFLESLRIQLHYNPLV